LRFATSKKSPRLSSDRDGAAGEAVGGGFAAPAQRAVHADHDYLVFAGRRELLDGGFRRILRGLAVEVMHGLGLDNLRQFGFHLFARLVLGLRGDRKGITHIHAPVVCHMEGGGALFLKFLVQFAHRHVLWQLPDHMGNESEVHAFD